MAEIGVVCTGCGTRFKITWRGGDRRHFLCKNTKCNRPGLLWASDIPVFWKKLLEKVERANSRG